MQPRGPGELAELKVVEGKPGLGVLAERGASDTGGWGRVLEPKTRPDLMKWELNVLAMVSLSEMTSSFTLIEGGSEAGLFSSFFTVFQKALGSELHRVNWDW